MTLELDGKAFVFAAGDEGGHACCRCDRRMPPFCIQHKGHLYTRNAAGRKMLFGQERGTLFQRQGERRAVHYDCLTPEEQRDWDAWD